MRSKVEKYLCVATGVLCRLDDRTYLYGKIAIAAAAAQQHPQSWISFLRIWLKIYAV